MIVTDSTPRPAYRIRPARGWSALRLRELWDYREVLWTLARRDVKLRYKQTILGVLWVVLQPLAAALIFAVIFGHLANLPSDGVPYGSFVLAGLIMWQSFAAMLQRAGPSLVTDSRMVTKVYFPRMLVPLAGAAAVGIDLVVALVVFAGLAWWQGVEVTWSLLWLPVWIGLTGLLAAGLSLGIAALNVRYRDVMHATPFMLQLWMYASPVVYATSLVPEGWRAVFALNPVVGLIEGFRQALLGTPAPDAWTIGVTVVFAAGAFVLGAAYFRKVEQDFAEWL